MKKDETAEAMGPVVNGDNIQRGRGTFGISFWVVCLGLATIALLLVDRTFSGAFSLWEGLEGVSGLVVALACVGEYFVEFCKWPREETTRHEVGRVCLVFLILGLVGELFFSAVATRISNRENSQLRNKAAEALRDAGEAIERSRKSELDRIELEARVEKMRAENLALESKLQWRTITPKQRDDLASVLASLRRTGPMKRYEVKVYVSDTDGEARQYAKQITLLLRECGLDATVEPGFMLIDPTLREPLLGLKLSMKRDDPPPPHLNPILDGFVVAGIPINSCKIDTNVPEGVVKIWVCQKPFN